MNTTKGLNFARVAAALIRCKGDRGLAANFAQAHWPGSPVCAEVLKAAVATGDATTSGWASELVPFGIAEDFLQFVRAKTVIDRLTEARKAPFFTKIPSETGGVAGAWVRGGNPIPAASMTFDQLSLPAYLAGVLVALDDELLQLLSPAAVIAIRDSLAKAVVEYLDQQFLDPAIALVADTNPASITSGATQISSTGATAATMTADVASMIDATDDLVNPIWIARGKTIATMSGTLGLPGINVIDGFLSGIPILATKSSPAPVGSPAAPNLLVLLDQDAVVIADSGNVDVQFSRVTSIQMSDVPSGAQQHTSMFQTASAAARVTRQIAWLRTRDAGICYMETDY